MLSFYRAPQSLLDLRGYFVSLGPGLSPVGRVAPPAPTGELLPSPIPDGKGQRAEGCQTLFLVSHSARKNQKQSLTPRSWKQMVSVLFSLKTALTPFIFAIQ